MHGTFWFCSTVPAHFVRFYFQGQELGSKLFDFGESFAPTSKVNVRSICDNLFPFYEKRGYVVTSRDPADKHIPANLLTRSDLEMVTLTKSKEKEWFFYRTPARDPQNSKDGQSIVRGQKFAHKDFFQGPF